jgi:hypothetical protein
VIVLSLFEFHVVELREQRHLVGGTQVSPHQSISLLYGVPRLPVHAPIDIAGRLTRLVEAVTFDVELPAVVAASDAVVLDVTEEQRCPPVSAVRIEQTWPALAVAEEDEVLPEDPNRPRSLRHRGCGRNRLPVATKELPTGGVWPDLGEEGVGTGFRPSVGGSLEDPRGLIVNRHGHLLFR